MVRRCIAGKNYVLKPPIHRHCCPYNWRKSTHPAQEMCDSDVINFNIKRKIPPFVKGCMILDKHPVSNRYAQEIGHRMEQYSGVRLGKN